MTAFSGQRHETLAATQQVPVTGSFRRGRERGDVELELGFHQRNGRRREAVSGEERQEQLTLPARALIGDGLNEGHRHCRGERQGRIRRSQLLEQQGVHDRRTACRGVAFDGLCLNDLGRPNRLQGGGIYP